MQTCREIEITNERVNSDKSQLLLTIKIDSLKTMMVERSSTSSLSQVCSSAIIRGHVITTQDRDELLHVILHF